MHIVMTSLDIILFVLWLSAVCNVGVNASWRDTSGHQLTQQDGYFDNTMGVKASWRDTSGHQLTQQDEHFDNTKSPDELRVTMDGTRSRRICKDNHQYCPFWGQQGECRINPKFMMVNCGYTCNSCFTGDSPDELRVTMDGTRSREICRDNHQYCPFWGQQGECRISPKYMMVNCGYTCNSCFTGVRNRNAISRQDNAHQDCIDRETKAVFKKLMETLDETLTRPVLDSAEQIFSLEAEAMATSACEYEMGCQDLVPMCPLLAGQGECSSNSSFMLVNCPVSCNSCLPREASECSNKADDISCDLSAELGLCEVNYAHNLRRCSGSCRMTQSLKEKCSRTQVSSCPGMKLKSLRTPDFECGITLTRRKRLVMSIIPLQSRDERRLKKPRNRKRTKNSKTSKRNKYRREKNSEERINDPSVKIICTGTDSNEVCAEVITSIKSNEFVNSNIRNKIKSSPNNSIIIYITNSTTKSITKQVQQFFITINIINNSNYSIMLDIINSTTDNYITFKIIIKEKTDNTTNDNLIDIPPNTTFYKTIEIGDKQINIPSTEPFILTNNEVIVDITITNTSISFNITEISTTYECSYDDYNGYSCYRVAGFMRFIGPMMPMMGMMTMGMMNMLPSPSARTPPEGVLPQGRFAAPVPVVAPVPIIPFVPIIPLVPISPRSIPPLATLSGISSIPDTEETRNAARTLMPFCDINGYLELVNQLQAITITNNGNQLDPQVVEISKAINYCRHGIGEIPPLLAVNNITKDTMIDNASQTDIGATLGITALGSDGEMTENDRKRFFCGASLITNRHILTAAHCIINNPKPEVVRLGERDFRTVEESRSADYLIKKITRHPDYELLSSYNDIAVIELHENVTDERTDSFMPYCLPFKVNDLGGLTGTASGWGTRPNIGPSNILINVNVTVTSLERCNDLYSQSSVFKAVHPRDLDETTLCAAGDSGEDVCTGDSGGPLVMYSEEGIAGEIGIVSQGNGCGNPDYPGIYTRTDAYLVWLDQVVYGDENESICSP